MKHSETVTKRVSAKNLIFPGFIFLYTCFLLLLSYKLNIWEDESYSLNTTSQSLTNVVRTSYDFEGQPPVYFILLSLWRILNSGIFFARLLSIVSIGLAAYFFNHIVRQVSLEINSKWMVTLFLLNPFTVWAALEIRLYALLLFLSAATVYFFIKFYKQSDKKSLYYFLIISLIGIYTQYFFAFLIAALAFFILWKKGWKLFVKFCFYLIPVVIFSLPNLIYLRSQINMLQSHRIEYSYFERISAVMRSIQSFMLGLDNAPFGKNLRWLIKAIFFLLFFLTYFLFLKKQNHKISGIIKKINYIVIIIVFTLILFFISIIYTHIYYRDKYMAVVFPLFMLLFLLFQTYSPRIRNTIYILISIYFAVLLISRYFYPIKQYDFPQASEFIQKIEQKREHVLFYTKGLLPPFKYYYHGSNDLYSLPPLKFDHNYYEENIKDTQDLKDEIEKTRIPGKSFLLVTNRVTNFKTNLQLNNAALDKFLKTEYDVTLDTMISGEMGDKNLRIRRLVPK